MAPIALTNTKEKTRKEWGAPAELSINSVVGLTTLETMKTRGSLGNKSVVVLVDCEASHNFISKEVVRQLGLPLSSTTGYGIIMGTGLTVKGQGICKGIKLQLQNVTVIDDFLPLELGILDIILGMQWLRKLGEMQVKW